ncbi:MAG: glutamate--tRNA ligase [Candidatus Uhrbacteria bacterium]|nr:glutamate--tRNA ligase [Candidatus Uhrbacteria bacterium]
MQIRTRIAPSPTGFVHIGTLHTALFNYFFTRQNGGKFVIRIEDTDRERLVEGAVENLLESLAVFGIENDEGPFIDSNGVIDEKGDFGPYTQSARLDIYKPYVQQLVLQGDAYYCFCTRERLDEMRKAQQAIKQTPKYDRACCKLDNAEVKARIDAGEAHVVRMKVPEGETTFTDLIRGTIKINNKEIDDQVILKSDGFPTYHLAVVVDDFLMQITHIIRGEEWLPSAPKHVILYKMLGFELPKFAHVPLLLNPDKTKLSKRQGDVAVEDYVKRGYLPDALINFVGTLGFNPSADKEIFTRTELTKLFDLSKVNKSGAVMNMEKLDWMNREYMRLLSIDELAEAARSFVQADVESEPVRRALVVERERVHRLDELQEAIDPYLIEPAYDPSMLVWKKADSADAKLQLDGIRGFIQALDDATIESVEKIEAEARAYIDANELQNGNVLWPMRVALSGHEKSASPFEFLWALGKGAALQRIDKAIGMLNK